MQAHLNRTLSPRSVLVELRQDTALRQVEARHIYQRAAVCRNDRVRLYYVELRRPESVFATVCNTHTHVLLA